MLILSLAACLLTSVLLWRNGLFEGNLQQNARLTKSKAGSLDLHPFVTRLRGAKTPQETSQIIAELSATLSNAPTAGGSAAIEHLLDSGVDASGLGEFSLTAQGALKSAPSLRVFLLDQLFRIDPRAGAAYAQRILARRTSANEWAISLRNVGLYDRTPEGKQLLQEKVHEMIRDEAWRQNPSAGYLEAFDVLVFTRDTGFTPDLAALISQKDNPAVAHAAYVALDRLVLVDAAAALEILQRQPDLLQEREGTRAGYFARADPADPRQRQLLEQYVLDPKRSLYEGQQFLALFPSRSFRVSENLLTRDGIPTRDELLERDRQAHALLSNWLLDPRFKRFEKQIETAKIQLEDVFKQARIKPISQSDP